MWFETGFWSLHRELWRGMESADGLLFQVREKGIRTFRYYGWYRIEFFGLGEKS